MLKVINEISKKNDEANKILLGIKKINDELDTAGVLCTKTDGTKYDFNRFSSPFKFVEKIYNYKITLDEAIDNQEKLEKLIIRLENYGTNKSQKKRIFHLKVRYLKQKKKTQKKNQKKK